MHRTRNSIATIPAHAPLSQIVPICRHFLSVKALAVCFRHGPVPVRSVAISVAMDIKCSSANLADRNRVFAGNQIPIANEALDHCKEYANSARRSCHHDGLDQRSATRRPIHQDPAQNVSRRKISVQRPDHSVQFCAPRNPDRNPRNRSGVMGWRLAYELVASGAILPTPVMMTAWMLRVPPHGPVCLSAHSAAKFKVSKRTFCALLSSASKFASATRIDNVAHQVESSRA